MKVLFNTGGNFKARYIHKVTIHKFNEQEKQGYIPVDTSLVEINPNNKKDVDAVGKAIKNWGYEDEFGYCIYDDLNSIRDGCSQGRNNKVYAITLQSNHLRTMDGNKILGLGEVTKESKKIVNIDYLQVEPESTFLRGSKKYINTGRNLVHFFQEKFSKKIITVKSTYRAANFYEKMGFEIFDVKHMVYIFKPFKKR